MEVIFTYFIWFFFGTMATLILFRLLIPIFNRHKKVLFGILLTLIVLITVMFFLRDFHEIGGFKFWEFKSFWKALAFLLGFIGGFVMLKDTGLVYEFDPVLLGLVLSGSVFFYIMFHAFVK